MTVEVFQHRKSELRTGIKFFKENFDDRRALQREEPKLRFAALHCTDVVDLGWVGEAFHQLGLMQARYGTAEAAYEDFGRALDLFEPYRALSRARVLRDYALLLAEQGRFTEAEIKINEALQLHRQDLARAGGKKLDKGNRQQRITESYLMCINLLTGIDCEDSSRLLVTFALSCDDCSDRDLHRVLGFALSYPQYLSLHDRVDLEAARLDLAIHRGKHEQALVAGIKFGLSISTLLTSAALNVVVRKG